LKTLRLSETTLKYFSNDFIIRFNYLRVAVPEVVDTIEVTEVFANQVTLSWKAASGIPVLVSTVCLDCHKSNLSFVKLVCATGAPELF